MITKKVLFIILVCAGFLTIIIAGAVAQSAKNSYQFDFGTGRLASGSAQVTATTLYSDSTNYGFDYGSQPVCINRGGNDTSYDDFCTGNAPFFFSVNLPQGAYDVTVIYGDASGSSKTTLKAESRRLMDREVQTVPGEFKEKTYTLTVWSPEIENGDKVHLKDRELDKLDWDHKLTLEFNNSHPVVDAINIKPNDSAHTVFLAGNSTVTDQQLEPWACWGQMLPSFFKSGQISFADIAVSGSTLKAFTAQNRLEKIDQMVKPGDFFFIQFAHNDQKEGPMHVEPYSSYQDYLMKFVNVARDHDATPVLVTSMNRHFFNSDSTVKNTLGDYPAAMRQLAQKENIALVDLNAMSKTLYEAYGKEESGRLFVQFPAGTFPGVEHEIKDQTHFNDFGAYELAYCMMHGIRQKVPALADYLKSGIPAYDPAHPHPINPWFLPLTPMYTQVKPYGN